MPATFMMIIAVAACAGAHDDDVLASRLAEGAVSLSLSLALRVVVVFFFVFIQFIHKSKQASTRSKRVSFGDAPLRACCAPTRWQRPIRTLSYAVLALTYN